MKPKVLIAGASALACLLSGVSATWALTAGLSSFTTESWRRADVLANPRPLPDVPMQDQTGHERSVGDLCKKILVVDFIYTKCSTVCRSQGAVSAQLATQLRAQAQDVQVLSISFDPSNDTPAALTKFKRTMEQVPTTWQLARPMQGKDRQALLETFGVDVISDGFGGYDHNAALHVVSQCKLVRILNPEDIEGALKTVRTLIAEKSL